MNKINSISEEPYWTGLLRLFVAQSPFFEMILWEHVGFFYVVLVVVVRSYWCCRYCCSCPLGIVKFDSNSDSNSNSSGSDRSY